jgi:CheY-like chemotaxis protein
MDWLRQQLAPGSCQVEEALAKILVDVTALATNYHVRITHEYGKGLGMAAVPPVALRQSVLTVLSAIVPKIAHQKIHVTAQRTAAEVHIRIGLGELGSTFDEECASRVRVAHQILSPFGGSVELHGPQLHHVSLRAPAVSSVPVLVVDDNPDATELMQRYVQGSRFRIVTTNDGRETLLLACEDKVKAILIDIMMPEIDGWDLLAELRHHPATQDIPVAVCSVLPQHELSDVLGARMFIQKPLTQEVFLKALELLTSAQVEESW